MRYQYYTCGAQFDRKCYVGERNHTVDGCEVQKWSQWSDCDCQSRRQNRTREVVIPSGTTPVDCAVRRFETNKCQCPGNVW